MRTGRISTEPRLQKLDNGRFFVAGFERGLELFALPNFEARDELYEQVEIIGAHAGFSSGFEKNIP
jgi:hypothetical protein